MRQARRVCRVAGALALHVGFVLGVEWVVRPLAGLGDVGIYAAAVVLIGSIAASTGIAVRAIGRAI